MEEPKYKPGLKLVGEDGNAFVVMARAKRALVKAGADKEYLEKFFNEATGGDYDHLLATVMKYCAVY